MVRRTKGKQTITLSEVAGYKCNMFVKLSEISFLHMKTATAEAQLSFHGLHGKNPIVVLDLTKERRLSLISKVTGSMMDQSSDFPKVILVIIQYYSLLKATGLQVTLKKKHFVLDFTNTNNCMIT